jgi:hypothetical protein
MAVAAIAPTANDKPRQTDSGAAILASHNRGIVTRWKGNENCRVEIVQRLKPAILDGWPL